MEKRILMKDKWNGKKKLMLMLKLLLAQNGFKRGKVLKDAKVFHAFGENVYWHSPKIPSEPYMVSIHNNVSIATNVTLLTHDIIPGVLERSAIYNPENEKLKFGGFYMDTIEIFDNVFIGANTTILYNTKIGPNAIVAAGSVIVKDVEPGTIVGGNPARVIGYVEDLVKKREQQQKTQKRPTNYSTIEEIDSFFWEDKGE